MWAAGWLSAVLGGAAPGYAGVEREPLGPSSRRTGLVISEIMYQPAARPDGKQLEFVEIHNSEPTFADVGGYRLSGSIDYRFPTHLVIPAGGFVVAAKVPTEVAAGYGISNVVGGWTKSLAGGAGTIRLQNRNDAVLLEVEYSAAPPWPVAADGAGHSLVLARPSYGENSPMAWEASALAGGSPGQADPARTSPLTAITINEILAGSGAATTDFVELYNHGNEAVDLSGCVLTDHPATNRYRFAAPTEIPAGGFVTRNRQELGFGLNRAGEAVYLLSPDASWVVDAVRFGGQAEGFSWGRFPDGADAIRELRAPTPGGSNRELLRREVVISEIMYHPLSENDDDQYVELHNRGAQAVNLGGWRFTAGIDFTFPTNAVIPANGYVVAARNAARLRSHYPQLDARNAFGDFNGKLGKNGERLALAMPAVTLSTNAAGAVSARTYYVVVNELTYGAGGRWGQWSDGGGSSLELIDARGDNRLAANWADSDETAKAPWTTVEHTGVLDLGVGAADSLQLLLQGPGECLVDNVEVLAEGGGNRIANPTFDSGITGWFMQGTHERSSWEVKEGFDAAGSLRVRADGRGDTGANRIRSALSAPRPVVGKTATLRAKARWLRGEPGLLLRLHGNWLEADGRLTVPANLGTPGQKNSRAILNAGPAIYAVAHAPVLPAAQQEVVVTARVDDPDGVPTLILNYRVDPATDLVSVPMTDDGAGGDAVARDGLYSATLPGQAAGVTVAFHLQAADGFSPPATTLFPSDAPARECLVRYGETQPRGSLGAYHVWLTKNTTTQWTSRLKLHNTPLDATFVYGNSRVIYNLGACYAGSPWIRPNYSGPAGSLCGYELVFPNDDRFLGDSGMTLDLPTRDPTLQLEQVAYWMAEQMGLPYNYRRSVQLFVNGGKRGQIYEDTQRPGKDVLDEFYADDAAGDLFKLNDGFEFDSGASAFERDNGDPAATLEDFTTTDGTKKTARYRWHWRKRAESGTTGNYRSLFGLVDAMNAKGEAYAGQVEAMVDIDQWARIFMVEHMVGNWDSYGYSRGKNMFAYKPTRGKWQLLMWDIDFVLGAQSNPAGAAMFSAADPVISRLFNNPQFTRAYYRAMRDAVNGPLLASNVEPLLDAKYAAFLTNGISATKPTAAKTYIKTCRDVLLQSLTNLPVDFAIAVASGTNLSATQNWVEISGTAPIEAKTLKINGAEYPVRWQNALVWSARVVLSDPTNRFVFEAFDDQGKAMANASTNLTINYPGTLRDPRDWVALNEIMFHPAAAGSEFVELYNRSAESAFDLSNYRLAGADFTFAAGTLIGPGDYLVVAQDRVAFMAAYGANIPIAGEFQGRLNPAGESLRLVAPSGAVTGGQVIDEVAYSNQFPWPEAADGQGGSLQLIAPAANRQRPGNWGAIGALEAAQPRWRYVSVTGVASTNSHLLVYHSPYQAPRAFNDIGGSWVGYIDVGFQYALSAAFQPQTSGWAGTVNLGNDIPLQIVQVVTNSVKFGFDYNGAVNWDGRLTADGNTIKGTFTQPGSSFPFTLKREIDPKNFPGGEVYVDDLKLVAGTDPEAGVNWIRDGDFEAPLTNAWQVASNHVVSGVTNAFVHSGQGGLHLVATSGGADEQSAVWQAVEGLVPGQVYTLSYWYLPMAQGHELTVRLADSDLGSSDPVRRPTAATPGAVNSIWRGAGESLPLTLTEVQPENPDGIQDAQGHRSPWVELFNAGSNAISLKGCYLSATTTNLLEWAFPADAVIQPGQYRLVWLDGAVSETTASEWHAGFRASPTRGLVALARASGDRAVLIDGLVYEGVPAGLAYGLFDGQYGAVISLPSPGAANPSGSPAQRVAINEWMAMNTHTLANPADGKYADWLELYNPNGVAVNLAGYSLTDDLAAKTKWILPADARIAAGGFLLVWADGTDGKSMTGGALHANFKLGQAGETIGLFAPDGELVDSVAFGPQIADQSQGRWPDGDDGSYHALKQPTPGAANTMRTDAEEIIIIGLTMGPGGRRILTWTSEPGARYQAQYKRALADSVWQNLGAPIAAAGMTASVEDTSGDARGQCFYRVTRVE